jgi:hypothetical protein
MLRTAANRQYRIFYCYQLRVIRRIKLWKPPLFETVLHNTAIEGYAGIWLGDKQQINLRLNLIYGSN